MFLHNHLTSGWTRKMIFLTEPVRTTSIDPMQSTRGVKATSWNVSIHNPGMQYRTEEFGFGVSITQKTYCSRKSLFQPHKHQEIECSWGVRDLVHFLIINPDISVVVLEPHTWDCKYITNIICSVVQSSIRSRTNAPQGKYLQTDVCHWLETVHFMFVK